MIEQEHTFLVAYELTERERDRKRLFMCMCVCERGKKNVKKLGSFYYQCNSMDYINLIGVVFNSSMFVTFEMIRQVFTYEISLCVADKVDGRVS
jgi:hypothetical protein